MSDCPKPLSFLAFLLVSSVAAQSGPPASKPATSKPATSKPAAAPAVAQQAVRLDKIAIDSTTLERIDWSCRSDISTHLANLNNVNQADSIWTTQKATIAQALARDFVKTNPDNPEAHAIRYLAALELGRDRKKARTLAVQSTKALQKKPMALATFIRKGLFVDATKAEYQVALLALQPVVFDARKIGIVRSAHIQALLGCGKAREAMVTNKTVVDDLKDSRGALLDLVRTICSMENGRIMGGIARKAFNTAMKGHKPDAVSQMIEYSLLLNLEMNVRAADKLEKQMVDAAGSSPNNWLWYLMTRRETVNLHPRLWLRCARKMMQTPEDLSSAEMDTVALVLFKNRYYDEALWMQDKAVAEDGGLISDGVKERLVIFKAFCKKHGIRAKQPVLGKPKKAANKAKKASGR